MRDEVVKMVRFIWIGDMFKVNLIGFDDDLKLLIIIWEGEGGIRCV